MGLRVVGVDAAAKRGLVVDECGAEAFVAVADGADSAKQVKELTPGGAGVHAVVVATASNAAYATAAGMCRFGGTVVCVGIPEGQPRDLGGLSPQVVVGMELRVIGVAVGGRKEARECLEMAERGIVKVLYRVVGLGELTEVSRPLFFFAFVIFGVV